MKVSIFEFGVFGKQILPPPPPTGWQQE